MVTNPLNTGVRKSQLTAQLPLNMTLLKKRIESALPPAVQKWVAEEVQRMAGARQNMLWLQMRLRLAIRLKFSPAGAQSANPQQQLGPQLSMIDLYAYIVWLQGFWQDAQMLIEELEALQPPQLPPHASSAAIVQYQVALQSFQREVAALNQQTVNVESRMAAAEAMIIQLECQTLPAAIKCSLQRCWRECVVLNQQLKDAWQKFAA
jgi:hypothetical protein